MKEAENIDWAKWLSETETMLSERGYTRYIQNYKSEDFVYWKTIKEGAKKQYMIGLLFYDFRKYADRDPMANRISIQYECMILCGDRIDLSVSKDIGLDEFEEMAKDFYDTMKKYS